VQTRAQRRVRANLSTSDQTFNKKANPLTGCVLKRGVLPQRIPCQAFRINILRQETRARRSALLLAIFGNRHRARPRSERPWNPSDPRNMGGSRAREAEKLTMPHNVSTTARKVLSSIGAWGGVAKGDPRAPCAETAQERRWCRKYSSGTEVVCRGGGGWVRTIGGRCGGGSCCGVAVGRRGSGEPPW
jgi:hypothetical protein